MKKYRIGIIGTENYHAKQFTEFFNKPDKDGNLAFPDCHVTLVWGHYPQESEKVVAECGADKVACGIEEMVENVDAVMVTARDGKFHAEFVRPFIERGIPAFIDKPITTDTQEAEDLIALAKAKGVPLCGGSSLRHSKQVIELKKAKAEASLFRGGFVSAPLSFSNEYSGFWFYSSHLAEMCLEIFGYNPKSVVATENNQSVYATINYDGFSVNCNFVNDSYNSYAGAVFSKEKTDMKEVSLDDIFLCECEEFVNMVRTGEMLRSYEDLIKPVYLLDAIKKSYESGKKVDV
ncbi:MAG: Gfo/Idh/MocA family oxidoreductase [Clostridiales bacterium]|nr:Gfo/Idh/MocA family oxidoreductase [Clostridiales bacterium]